MVRWGLEEVKDWLCTGELMENKKSRLRIMGALLLTVREGRSNIKREKTERNTFQFGRLEFEVSV